jgi:glutathione S-transferase
MIDLYYWTTPNGHKITIFLEETGVPHKIVPVNISQGDQFKPEFLSISPNNRIPAIVDHEPKDDGRPIMVFESGAILLYLAEKTGKFMRTDLRRKAGDRVAVLANGRPRSNGWSKPSLQSLRANKDPIRDRPIRERDKPPVWRTQQASCRSRVRRERVFHSGHGHLSLDCSAPAPRTEVAGLSASEALV